MQFLFKQGLEPDQVNKEGRTLIDMAATANAPQIVKMLLQYPDVDPNQIIIGETLSNSKGSKIKGGTCLHTAAKKGYFEVVEVLLNDRRVVIEQKDAAGKTALDYAIAMNRSKTIKILSNPRNSFWRILWIASQKALPNFSVGYLYMTIFCIVAHL
jgi:ankyrin repeat protein